VQVAVCKLLEHLFPCPAPKDAAPRTALAAVDGEDLFGLKRETLETVLTMLEQHPLRPLRMQPRTRARHDGVGATARAHTDGPSPSNLSCRTASAIHHMLGAVLQGADAVASGPRPPPRARHRHPWLAADAQGGRLPGAAR